MASGVALASASLACASCATMSDAPASTGAADFVRGVVGLRKPLFGILRDESFVNEGRLDAALVSLCEPVCIDPRGSATVICLRRRIIPGCQRSPQTFTETPYAIGGGGPDNPRSSGRTSGSRNGICVASSTGRVFRNTGLGWRPGMIDADYIVAHGSRNLSLAAPGITRERGGDICASFSGAWPHAGTADRVPLAVRFPCGGARPLTERQRLRRP